MSDAMVYPALGSYVRGLRECKGWSREQLAQQLGVSSRQVTNWESGINVPGTVHLVRLLRALEGAFSVVASLVEHPDLTLDDALARIEAEAASSPALRHPVVVTRRSPVVEQHLLAAYEQLGQALASLPGRTGQPALRTHSAVPAERLPIPDARGAVAPVCEEGEP